MDLFDIVTLLDTNFVRECVMFKDNILMQKTVNYINTSMLPLNINNQTFNNINQLIFITKNNSLYLYLITNLFNNNQKTEEIEINAINSFTIGAG